MTTIKTTNIEIARLNMSWDVQDYSQNYRIYPKGTLITYSLMIFLIQMYIYVWFAYIILISWNHSASLGVYKNMTGYEVKNCTY